MGNLFSLGSFQGTNMLIIVINIMAYREKHNRPHAYLFKLRFTQIVSNLTHVHTCAMFFLPQLVNVKNTNTTTLSFCGVRNTDLTDKNVLIKVINRNVDTINKQR